MPTSSDLVTDLPADFEVFGQAVDTALADLKGGTTGQVLSKTTGTDMDFTWVDTDDTNAIQNAIVDAKGDLIAASAADTPARLAVGNNGETLVADSSTSTGLRYQGSMAAGKNFLINGAFDIWQRGTSFSSPAGTAYTVDRWNNNNSAGGTTTISQETTGVPAGSQYCLRTAYGAASSYSNKAQIIETNNTKMLQGKTVTFTVKLRRNASFSGNLSVGIAKNSGTDAGSTASWTDIATTTVVNASLPTGTTSADWYTATVTAAIPNDGTANSLRASVNEVSVGASGAYWEMAEAQLELGSVATAFSRNGGTIQGELSAAQRYYFRNTGGSSDSFYGSLTAYSTTQGVASIPLPVTMRVEPTSIDFGNICLQRDAGQGRQTITAATISTNYSGVNAVGVDITVASGLTAGTFYYLQNNNNTAGFVGFSAEL